MADVPTTCDIAWPSLLYERRGAPDRLRGIKVLHDFPWLSRFAGERTMFQGGKSLAEAAHSDCPPGKEAVLLLTALVDADRFLGHARYHITVVAIDEYLAASKSDPATVFFSRRAGINPIAAARLGGIDPNVAALLEGLTITQEQRDLLAMTAMSPELLQAWLRADPERVALLTPVIREFDRGEDLLETMRGRPPQEAVTALIELLGGGGAAVEALLAAGAELSVALADSRILQVRRNDCAEFRQHLEGGGWLEQNWQTFFEQRTWIFGYGLRYQFLHAIQHHPNLGEVDFTGRGGQHGDYLVATTGNVQFTVLVEIKRPESGLVGALYRNRTYSPGHDLASGVAQMQQECVRWALASTTPANVDRLRQLGLFTQEPRGILVIGNTAQLEGDIAKIRTFESFRRNLVQPEVLTFDELLCRAEAIVALGEATVDVHEPVEQESQPADDVTNGF